MKFTRKSVFKMLAVMEASQSAAGPSTSTSNVPVTPDGSTNAEEFLSSGRTGRRNALPDILSQHAIVSSSDLTSKLQGLSTSDKAPEDKGNQPGTRDARPVDDSVDHGNVNIDVSSNLSTEEAHGSEGTTTPDISEAEDAQKSTGHVCVFCNKNRKKYQGREQQLQTCATDESIVSLKRNVSEIGDVDLLNKITAEYE
ncbi:hypothetical protein JTB14_035254 [Gonioctena quinquepunctata]|nr:hypothetical protein JTB14_035254 [Gonioctena quinquepunctata]